MSQKLAEGVHGNLHYPDKRCRIGRVGAGAPPQQAGCEGCIDRGRAFAGVAELTYKGRKRLCVPAKERPICPDMLITFPTASFQPCSCRSTRTSSIDERGLRGHLRDVGTTKGLSAITVNAHSTEVASCSFEEQQRVLDIALDEIGDRLPLVSGVWADGSLEAARIARMASQRGASALLVFPPAPFTLGQTAAMAVAHFRRIADATDLPLIAFQYPLATGQGYPRNTLLAMIEQVPTIRAIKDWAGNVPQHEMHVRTLQSLSPPVNVLTTHSAWLLSSLVLGCNGLLSGSGSVIADLQAQLFRAVQAKDLADGAASQ